MIKVLVGHMSQCPADSLCGHLASSLKKSLVLSVRVVDVFHFRKGCGTSWMIAADDGREFCIFLRRAGQWAGHRCRSSTQRCHPISWVIFLVRY